MVEVFWGAAAVGTVGGNGFREGERFSWLGVHIGFMKVYMSSD